MHNKIRFIILLPFLFNSTAFCFGINYKYDEIESFVGRTMETMEKASMETIERAKEQLEDLKKHMAKELQQTEQSIKDFTDQINTKVMLDVLEEKDGVSVAITLPKKSLQSNLSEEVKLQAKGNSLDGTINYGNYTLKVAIADGQVAQISYSYNSQDEKQNSRGFYFRQASSVCTQSVVLPTPVDNLENTKADFRDGKLRLMLPKKQAIARGWCRIEVK